MKLAPITVAVTLLAAPVMMSATACDPPKPWVACGNVDTQPQSDVGAWSIEAHKTDCLTARGVADHDFRLAPIVNRKIQPYTYQGWHCSGGLSKQGLGQDIWCNGPNGGVVTFTWV